MLAALIHYATHPCAELNPMYLVAIAWLYVALLMAAAEATHSQGSVLGAFFTFLLYGLGPVALMIYLLGTPARRAARRRADASQASTPLDPDGGGHAPAVAMARTVATERKEA
ncbi:hypothetical protein [Methylibium petroleiphilum]|uniref:hypothetical protein n=1 Tax=Methylibium petroleiphilum TaxID=105560 RepID=UPI003D2AC2BB